ncbi:oligoendopeptidase F [Mycoplasmopsis bovis]|uniref:oligoendopeptidase F n=1 Tax=Mycoplasmopsis bovis TaxID=28903 RepID=UPI00065297E1|nr:oligoendopeptidase F [Mycoplasmopsis bovis]AKO50360.1 oligoendopeptidase F [Mycoplasmopsis bovis]
MKQYPSYDKVNDEYKWDIESILEGQSFDYWLDKYVSVFKQLIEIKDSKYSSIESFIAGLKINEQMEIVANKLHNYISNKTNINLTDSKAQEMALKFDSANEELNKQYGSEINRFFKNADKLKSWVNDERLKSYKKMLTDTLDSFNHKLSNDVEDYLTEVAFGEPNLDDVFSILTDAELRYDDVLDSKNKKHKLDPISYSKMLKSDDATLRKNAVLQYRKAKLQHKESLANMLIQTFKNISVNAKVRKYKDSINMLTYEDKVNDEILLKLFSNIASLKNDIAKYWKHYKKYYEAHFNEKFRPLYDANRDIFKVKNKYSVEEAKDIVYNALLPFGSEYSDTIKQAYKEKWVDFMSVKNKLSGAYSIGNSYGIDKKFILMNFDGELNSVETLAHELGHSMHSYFSDKNNDITNASYPIFLAEIASIFNELILYDYLIEKSSSKIEKFTIYGHIISGFFGTTVTQAKWANYEYELYKKVDLNEVAPNYEEVSKIYYETLKKYYKKPRKYKKEEQIAAVTIPHFYMGFYVYKYAIGQLVANHFYTQYKMYGKEFLNKYINNFLSAGNRDYPLNTLKNMGIDLTSDQFYKSGFAHFHECLNQWIKLGNEIFSKEKKKKK